MDVPFVDLAAQYKAHRTEFDEALQSVIQETAFIGGRFVREFEDAYAAEYGVKHCISVANGTDAIYIVLRMLGVGSGDEVITSAASWISTSEAISECGAKPVFVDVDEFYNINVAAIEAKITPRSKAVLPVHLYGQAARMTKIAEICRTHNLLLVEDCAQAHFACHAGQKVGTFGAAGTFSFYPGKNLGAYGDGGAIITDDANLARLCRMYANHGALRKHEHEMEGVNSRLDGLQASLLTAKLKHIHEWTRMRQHAASLYSRELEPVPEIVRPSCDSESSHVYHLYVIRARQRDKLRLYLAERGIETGVHYPRALPFLPAYAHLDHRPEEFPVAHRNQSGLLSLPIYPEMTVDMIQYVVKSIREFYAHRVSQRLADAGTLT